MKIPPEICEKCRPFFELLLRKIEELERRLLKYENSNVPPSQNNRNYPKREKSNNPVGAPKNHEGTTRPLAKPNRFINLKQKNCPDCDKHLGRPVSIQTKIIEDSPDPQPLKITEFTIPHYFCNCCKKEIIPTHPELPEEGRFGPNLLAEISLLRFEDRLPPRKIAQVLNRQYNLKIVHATVLDILGRVSDRLQFIYESIKEEIRNSTQVNADETGNKINGKKTWTWVFVSLLSVLYLITNTRGQKPIKEVLGKIYRGILGCDGWTSYPKVVEYIQRCWAHLLREAKWHAEKYEGQARKIYIWLCEIFVRVKKAKSYTKKGLTRAYNWCIKQMRLCMNICKNYTELRKFAIKIENGFDYWFTCLKHPEIEPTNNKAERALRELVIQRKISKLRTEEGARITETIMSVLATWRLRGLNTYSMLRQILSS